MLTSTRPVNVYVLSDPDDREQFAVDHAQAGWTVAIIAKPGSPVARAVSAQLTADPVLIEGRFPTFDDVIISDLILVQGMTRDAYNAAHPDNPLPEGV